MELYDRTLKNFRLKAGLTQLRKAELTAADWRIWSYLEEISGGDRKAHAFPPVESVKKECRVSRTTFYRAIASLQECGFLELN